MFFHKRIVSTINSLIFKIVNNVLHRLILLHIFSYFYAKSFQTDCLMPNNQHLVEVLFAIWFDPSQNEWDSTYFGKYYERVESRGYTEKQEQKPVKVKLDISHKNRQTEVTEDEPRMVFRNPTQKTAIILGNHFISFHKLAPYENWEKLIEEVVKPGLEIYFEMGLGRNMREVQCLYLNKYDLELAKGERISKYFNFLPTIDDSFETNISFQGKYDLPENKTVQLRLNGNSVQNEKMDLFFECSCFVKSSSKDDDYLKLADIAHEQANSVFRKIITP